MPAPPPLTAAQKKELSVLEPQLRLAVVARDYEAARSCTASLQALLVPTGHVTRLMKAKCWLFEAAMESGNLSIAISGFIGIRKKTNEGTRVHLEATALLAICHLRNSDVSSAEPLIAQVIKSESQILSPGQRRKFRKRVVERFDEEALFTCLRALPQDRLNVEEIQEEAGQLLMNRSEAEVYVSLGQRLPSNALEFLRRVNEVSMRQLPPEERNLLPPPTSVLDERSLGQRMFSAAKRTLWHSLCDPKSDVYKSWFASGLQVVLERKFLGTAIIVALTGAGIAVKALAVSGMALVLKMGVEVYCRTFEPTGVLDEDAKRG